MWLSLPGAAAPWAPRRRVPLPTKGPRSSSSIGTRLPPQGRFDEKPLYLLTTTTLMLLRGKALNLTVYSAYEGPADVEWMRSITARWIGELQRLNNR